MAERLVAAWQDQAGWRDILHISLPGILRRDGLFDHKKLRALLRRNIQPSTIPDPAPIELLIVVAPLQGVPGRIGNKEATTYTKVLRFGGEHFDRPEGLEEVFTAAIASASFPCLFTPTLVPGVGLCIDGGLVNSTPVRHACAGELGSSVDAVLVVAPTPVDRPEPRREFHGRSLLTHLTDMLFSERLYHDLRDVLERNALLSRIEALARQEQWTPEQVGAFLEALGLTHKRVLPLVPIRPLTPLPGDPFSGLFSATERRRYIEEGMARASAVLDELGWH
jgi:predicted acylesterase/phospholipase RssA